MNLDPDFEEFTARDWQTTHEGRSRLVLVGLGGFVDEVAEEFDYFAHCVLTDADPEPDGRDSVADMEAVEAIYESAETGRRVEVGSA